MHAGIEPFLRCILTGCKNRSKSATHQLRSGGRHTPHPDVRLGSSIASCGRYFMLIPWCGCCVVPRQDHDVLPLSPASAGFAVGELTAAEQLVDGARGDCITSAVGSRRTRHLPLAFRRPVRFAVSTVAMLGKPGGDHARRRLSTRSQSSVVITCWKARLATHPKHVHVVPQRCTTSLSQQARCTGIRHAQATSDPA